MKHAIFQEVMESVKQGGAILRGETPASRTFTVERQDVQKIRKQYGLLQTQFARLLGISVSTVRNWEQGRRRPEGAAQVLLRVAAKHPRSDFGCRSSCVKFDCRYAANAMQDLRKLFE